MTNTFSYKQIWTSGFQKSNWAMPIYPVIADLEFSDSLKMGDTVHRRYRSNPIFAKTLGTDGSYSPQNYAEADQTFTISKQKEATVRIVNTQVLMTDLPTTESYGTQLSNAIYQEIDGDTLLAGVNGAGQTIDASSLSGNAGDGISVSIQNIANIPVIAMEKFQGTNVVYSNNMKFGKLPYEDYGGMLCWVMPPQVWTVIQTYMIARVTVNGDNAATNGYVGQFGQFNCFISNNLPFSATLALATQPTDGDTLTIKGVTFRFKTALAANGDILIGGSASAANTNLAAALNAPTVTSAGYQAFAVTDTLTENTFVIAKTDALHGITATATATATTISVKGTGKVSVSVSMTAAGNLWTGARQFVSSLFCIAKNISLAVRKDPEIYENFVSNSVAKDYTLWTVYDNKVFNDQQRALISLLVRSDDVGFTAYSNVHA